MHRLACQFLLDSATSPPVERVIFLETKNGHSFFNGCHAAVAWSANLKLLNKPSNASSTEILDHEHTYQLLSSVHRLILPYTKPGKALFQPCGDILLAHTLIKALLEQRSHLRNGVHYSKQNIIFA